MTNQLLIKKPVMTEKAARLSRLNKYIFAVEKKTSAAEAKKLIERIYGVKVVKTNVVNVKNKRKRLGRTVGRVPGYKKVVFTLKEGQTIDIGVH